MTENMVKISKRVSKFDLISVIMSKVPFNLSHSLTGLDALQFNTHTDTHRRVSFIFPLQRRWIYQSIISMGRDNNGWTLNSQLKLQFSNQNRPSAPLSKPWISHIVMCFLLCWRPVVLNYLIYTNRKALIWSAHCTLHTSLWNEKWSAIK